MSYEITRKGREVMYERGADDRIDMYIYFNPNGRSVNGDHGVQPEDVLKELHEFVASMLDLKRGSTHEEQALEDCIQSITSSLEAFSQYRKHESANHPRKSLGYQTRIAQERKSSESVLRSKQN